MKRILATFLLACWPSLALAFGFSGVDPYSKFYIDSNALVGSDANNGTSPTTPWLTIAHANAQVYSANTKIFCSGTFTDGFAFTTTNAPSGAVTVTTYGSLGCTTNTGNSTAGYTATNVPAMQLRGPALTGGGNLTNTTAGISIINSQGGNTKLAGPTIAYVTVGGYGKNCIEVKGTNGTSGFAGANILHPIAHDCTGNYQPLASNYSGSSCINVFSEAGYGSGESAPSHTGVTVSDFLVYNCTGTAGSGNWSGSGVTVFQTSNFTMTRGVAHDYGINSTSPGGIWTADTINGTISYNEVYNGNGSGQNAFDVDGGSSNILVEYNKAHDNNGSDYAAENYTDVSCCGPWANNTFRFNVGQNAANSEFLLYFPAAPTGALSVYRNTFENFVSGKVVDQGSTQSLATATFANNIFGMNGTGNIVTVSHPGAVVFNGNDYFNYTPSGALNFSWNGSSYVSFAAWQTATGQEKISAVNVGLTSNPSLYVPGGLFTTSGYFPLQDMASNLQSGSGMIAGGVDLQANFGFANGGIDYFGAVITASSKTVGAAEGDFTTFAASCSPAVNYLARVSSFTKADNVNYNSLLCGMSTDGNLASLDFYHMLAAPNASASLLNLVSTSYSLVSHGGETFTARQGYVSNGTTGYLDTQFVPSTAGGNMILSSGSLGIYDLTGGIDNKCPIGSTNNTTTEISVFLYTTSGGGPGGFTDVNNFTGLTSISGGHFPNAKGFTAGSNALGVNNLWHNPTGNPWAFIIQAQVALTPNSIFVQAENVANTPATFTTDQIAMDFAGASPSNMGALALRTNSYMMAYGINVY